MWLASDHTHCKAFILRSTVHPEGLQRLLLVWAEQLILQALDPLFFLVKVREGACPHISLAVSQLLSGNKWQFNTSERPLCARSASSLCAQKPGQAGHFLSGSAWFQGRCPGFLPASYRRAASSSPTWRMPAALLGHNPRG